MISQKNKYARQRESYIRHFIDNIYSVKYSLKYSYNINPNKDVFNFTSKHRIVIFFCFCHR